ncbi:MAG: hypothetical protein J6A04_04820 [Clostridia bacterium]|nr:hypothetical protein [Clostridia bacterium]
MERINKILEYIKQNKLYVAVMIIGCAMFMIQMSHVVLYADDLFLGNIAKEGMEGAIKHLAFNYMNWGGGPTPLIVILLFFVPLNVWKILNCLMIAITIILAVRMISSKFKINKGIIAIILWTCAYALNIYISSQTLYWLDGNIAYVLTAFQLFIYFYYLYSRLIMKTKNKKYDYILLPIVAFFAGWTGPQAGAITVIVSIVLLLWVKFINKEKIKSIYLISACMGIVGFLVYYLAPGNNARMIESFPEFANYNLFEKIFYRMDSVWNLLFNYQTYRFASMPFYLYIVIGFISLISMKLVSKEKNKLVANSVKIMSVILLIFMILNFAISIGCDYNLIITNSIFRFEPILSHIQNGTFRLTLLVPYVITAGAMLFIVILSYYISYKEKNPLLVILVTCALLGQAMMVLSPYSPLRTTFITVYLLWIVIALLVAMIAKYKINMIWVIAMIFATMFELKLGVIISLTYIIFYNLQETKNEEQSNKLQLIIFILTFTILALISYKQMVAGYKENEEIYYQNIQLIEEFKKHGNSENTLYLKAPEKEQYGFTSFVGIDWVEEVVKQYFEIDENVIIEELQ